ncbi:MAG: hypothetical protein HY928_16805 [Elusimicrobia bacterium]|nr:hypothetical protein [Elusimicrobiota bacterium]
MRILLILSAVCLSLPARAAEHRSSRPSAMSVRRVAARASAMSLRRAGIPPDPSPAPVPSIPDPGPGAPAAAPPELGPRLTPPSGTTVPAHDLRKGRGVRYEEAEPARPGKPAPMVRDEALAAFQGAVQAASAAPAPAAAPPARVLQAGSDGRAVGGASDPVVFMTEAAPAAETGAHNRDQGGKPADPSSKGKGK